MAMKIRQLVIGVLGLIGLGIAFGVGRYFRSFSPRSSHDLEVTVYSNGNGTCYVNAPVIVMDHSADRVEWSSNDDPYLITFINIDPPVGSAPLPSGYQKETPLVPPTEPVTIDKTHPSGFFHVKAKVKYYYYAIFDQNYPSNPCKVSTDDHDTGVNVKR
jgi:hypothetical protein